MSTVRTVVRPARRPSNGAFMVYSDDNRAILDKPVYFADAQAIARKFAETNKRCARVVRVGVFA